MKKNFEKQVEVMKSAKDFAQGGLPKNNESFQSEKSCGGLIFRKHSGNTEILLVRHTRNGKWSFPKGHIENGETEIETAMREVFEETGINVVFSSEFRERVVYAPRRGVLKEVIYFAGFPIKPYKLIKDYEFNDAKDSDTPDHFVERYESQTEIVAAKFMKLDFAEKILTYGNDRAILKKAVKTLFLR